METSTFGNTIGTLDILVLSCFLVANIILGLISRRKCWDVKEAVFGKTSNFSDFTLVISMCATIISGTMLIGDVEQINLKGIKIVIQSCIMYPAMYFFVTFFLVPRIVVTKMAFSWYEHIGNIFGKSLRVFFALCYLIRYLGWFVALFFSIYIVTQIAFNCSPAMSQGITICFGIILTIYSAFGGFRAVTITDILQFIVFFILIIFIALYMWISSSDEVHASFIKLFDGTNPKISFNSCFGSPKLTIATLSFWAVSLVPDFPHALYQRCYACKSLKKTKKNMLLASIIVFFFFFLIAFIGLQVMNFNNNLEQHEIIPFLVNKMNLPGIRGLFCIAVLAMTISSADSCLNSCSIVFSNDIYSPLTQKDLTPNLIRKVTYLLGFLGLFISLYSKSIFDVIMTAADYVSPSDFPMLFIMLGLKTHKNVLYIAISVGYILLLGYKFIFSEDYGYIFGLCGSGITLLISHIIWKKYFRSDDPNMYYNQKDSFKRLKDFEYDDDLMSYTEYKLKSGEWKEDLEEALRKQNEEEENAELQKRFHAIVKERMKSVVEEYDREKAEDEAYNKSLQEKKAQDYDRSIYKEKDATKDFYELKDLPETCAAYGIVKKAGHKMCRQDILNQYINESWQWKRNHPEDLNGPNNMYNDSIPVPEKIFGIKIMPKKKEKNEDPMQNITVDDFVDLRKRFKKAVKEKMEEMGLKYVPDIEDELELMKNEQENEQKIVKKYKELWLEEIRKEQEEEKKNKKKKK